MERMKRSVFPFLILMMFSGGMGVHIPSAQAGWMSSWFGGLGQSQSTADIPTSSVPITVQPISPQSNYGGPRVLTVSPKGNTGATEITAKDLDMQQRVIVDRMQSNANIMEAILKNRAVAEAAMRDAQKISTPTAPAAPIKPVVPNIVMPAQSSALNADQNASRPIVPILPSGLNNGLVKTPDSQALSATGGTDATIHPILPNLGRAAPAPQKDNKP